MPDRVQSGRRADLVDDPAPLLNSTLDGLGSQEVNGTAMVQNLEIEAAYDAAMGSNCVDVLSGLNEKGPIDKKSLANDKNNRPSEESRPKAEL